MVVIKGTRNGLNKEFGQDFVERLYDFSEVIGFTIEEESGELKVEFNPDRPDLFSFISLNRSIRCYYDKDYWILKESSPSGIEMKVTEGVKKLRKYAAAFVANGKPISGKLETLMEYQERLHDGVGKNRSKVSIGIHDLGKVKPPFVYDAANKDSVKFTTFDGQSSGTARKILEEHPKGVQFSGLIPSESTVPLISDSSGNILSLPPVINGTASKVDSNTKDFFIDITGTDQKATRDAFYLLLYEFRHLGYNTSSVKLQGVAESDLNLKKQDGRKIDIEQSSLERITGLKLKQEEVIGLLRKMGFMAEPSSSFVKVTVPGNRIDVMGEVDVMEDIAKAYGVARIKEKKIDLPLVGEPERVNEFTNLLRDVMIGAGLQEVRTFVVASPQHYRELEYTGGLEIMNPKSVDYSMVRDRLYVNMMELLRINKRRSLPHRIFEIGDVYVKGDQEVRICALIMDTRASYSTIKQVMDYFALRLGVERTEVKPSKQEGFIEGRSGSVYFNDQNVGIIGELSPDFIVDFDLSSPVCAMELDIKKLME